MKKNIGIMYAIALLQGMVFYGAVATLYRQAVGVTVFQITLIESISLALALVLELPWGILAEKIGYKNTMIVCCTLYFVSKIVFWQAEGFAMFLLERVLLSVVIAGLSGVDVSILYLSCEKSYAHKAFSICNGMGTTGLLLASGVYTVFLKDSYRTAALLTVISYGAAMVLAFFLTEVKSQEERDEPAIREFVVILKDTLHRKELFLFLVSAALLSECNQTITVFLNQLQYVRAGMSNQMIGVAYIVTTIAGLISIRSAYITEKLGKRKAGGLFFAVGIVCCLLLMLTENPWVSVAMIVLLRSACSLFMPLAEVIKNQQVTHKNRATALSIYSVIMDGVAIMTNLLFGKASDYNLVTAFGVGVFFCAMGLWLFLYTTKRMQITLSFCKHFN